MKKIYIILSFLSLSLCTYSQHWEWAIYDTVSYMVSDSFGNVYTAGNYKIKRYKSDRNMVWQKQLAGNFALKGMVTDSAGDLYIICHFYSFSIDSFSFPSSGQTDIFFGKINSSGVLDWYKIFGALGSEYIADIFINNKQDIFICGTVAEGTIIETDTFALPGIFCCEI